MTRGTIVTIEATGDKAGTIVVGTFRNGRIGLGGAVRRAPETDGGREWTAGIAPALMTGRNDGPWKGTLGECLIAMIERLGGQQLDTDEDARKQAAHAFTREDRK